jgi:hypothetical protein
MSLLKGLLGKKTEPLKDELILFERVHPDDLFERSKKFVELFRKNKVFRDKNNIGKFQTYLYETQRFPLMSRIRQYNVLNDELLTLVFFYFWLGGVECFEPEILDERQIDIQQKPRSEEEQVRLELLKSKYESLYKHPITRCEQIEFLFNTLYNYAKDSKNKIIFDPFFYIGYGESRMNNIKNKSRSMGPGYAFVTLDIETPGGFIIVDGQGNMKKWNPLSVRESKTTKINVKTFQKRMNDMVERYPEIFTNVPKDFPERAFPYWYDLVDTIDSMKLVSKKPTVRKIKFSEKSEENKIFVYDFGDILYDLCKHSLSEEFMRSIPMVSNVVNKTITPTESLSGDVKTLKPLERYGYLNVTRDEKMKKMIREEMENIGKEIEKNLPTVREVIKMFRKDIVENKRQGNDVFIFGEAPKKDILIILEFIFEKKLNPFDASNIITLEDFGKKPCSKFLSRNDIREKLKEKLGQEYLQDVEIEFVPE